MATSDYLRRDTQSMEFAHLRIGQVASVNVTSRSCTVNLPGAAVTGVTFAGAAPQVGDIAYCIGENTTLVAIGFDRAGGTPLGTVVAFYGTVAPYGWKICDGSAFPAGVDYDPIRAIAGANAPDLRDRFIVGVSGTKALNATGGAATVALTEANLASHQHGINHDHGSVTSGNDNTDHSHGGTTGNNNQGHWHGQRVSGGAPGGGSYRYDYAGDGNFTPYDQGITTDVESGPHTHNFTTGGRSAFHQHSVDLPNFTGSSGAAGSGTAHENMPPYRALLFIIKALPV